MTRRPGATGRRAFLRDSALIVLGAASAGSMPDAALASLLAERRRTGRVALLTDVHYAEKDAAGTRHYRDSLAKVREAVARFNEEKADIAVELGDIVDAAPTPEREIEYLRQIEAAYADFRGERHYVLGNHCVATLTKEEFFANTAAEKGHYSFDRGGFHLVVLDACFRKDEVPYGRNNFVWNDTEVPASQRAWLARDLAATKLPAVVFVHQRLDVTKSYSVHSAAAARQILERSGNVVAVFQGHSHENDYQHIGGIHYCTLAAVVEGAGPQSSAYSVLDLYEDGGLVLHGFRRQTSREWPRRRVASL